MKLKSGGILITGPEEEFKFPKEKINRSFLENFPEGETVVTLDLFKRLLKKAKKP